MNSTQANFDPNSAVFLGAIIGSATQRNFVNSKYFSSCLALNILFFEHASLNALTMLSNTDFFDLFDAQTEALKHMFNSGILCPIIRTSKHVELADNFNELAEGMIKNNTFWGDFSEDKLKRYANSFNNSNPHYISMPDNAYWDLSVCTLRHMLRNLSNDSNSREFTSQILVIDNFIQQRYENQNMSFSDLWRYVDSNVNRELQNHIKSITDFAAVYASSFLTGSRISMDDGTTQYKKYLKGGWSDIELAAIQKDKFDIHFPFMALSEIPLSEVMQIRELDIFKTLRQDLGRIRSGENFSSQKLSEKINHCGELLLDHISKSSFDRGKNITHLLERDKKGYSSIFYYSQNSLVAFSIVDMLVNSLSVAGSVICFCSIALGQTQKYFTNIKNPAFDVNINTDSKFNTLQSEISILTKEL